MEIDDASVETIVNFIQTQKVPKEEHAAVKVGFKEVTISAGHEKSMDRENQFKTVLRMTLMMTFPEHNIG